MVKSPEKTSKKFMEIEKRYKKQPAMMRSFDKIGINQNLADLLPRTDDRRRLIGQHPVSSVSSLTWLFKFVHVQSVLFNGKLVTITSMATTHGIGFMCITFLLVITKWHWQRLLLFAVIEMPNGPKSSGRSTCLRSISFSAVQWNIEYQGGSIAMQKLIWS